MKEIPCKLKILDGKDVVELAGDSSTVVINEGDKVTISDSTIELDCNYGPDQMDDDRR